MRKLCENHAKTMRNTRGARRRKNKARDGESLLEEQMGTHHNLAMRKPCENHAKHQGRTEKKEQGKIWRIIAGKASGHTSQFRRAKAMRKPCENIWAPGREGKRERDTSPSRRWLFTHHSAAPDVNGCGWAARDPNARAHAKLKKESMASL